MGFNVLSKGAHNIPIRLGNWFFWRMLHEMTTAQESESGSHFDRDIRSIVVGVEYATASRHVSQSKRGSGAADSSTGCSRRPDIKRAALSRAGNRRAFG